MFKYILLILILVILLGHRQLVGAVQSMHSNFVDYYRTTITNNDPKTTDSQTSSTQKGLSLTQNTKIMQTDFRERGSLFSRLLNGIVDMNSWNYYKKTFISEDGRVIDHQRASVSTSEGQAYAMRRAIMMHDKKTFDKTYDWAKYNLQHKNDKLFAWLWGQKNPDGEKEIIYEIIDQNSASDADIEIAVCLIFAYTTWNQENYMEDAISIINDVWNKETIEINGERILTAGADQNKLENIEINPSYFMPYAFRILSVVDGQHDWHSLVDSSYRLTNWCIDNIKSGLPPDAFYINKNTGVITFDKDRSDFCYDAVRVFYRFYVDYTITKEPRTLKLLSKSNIFINRWKQDKKFYTCYKQDGEVKNYDEAIGSIAVILPVIKMYDMNVANEIYQNRIKSKYHISGYWGDPMDYYAQNLVWFGNWLYLHEENIKAFKY